MMISVQNSQEESVCYAIPVAEPGILESLKVGDEKWGEFVVRDSSSRGRLGQREFASWERERVV